MTWWGIERGQPGYRALVVLGLTLLAFWLVAMWYVWGWFIRHHAGTCP